MIIRWGNVTISGIDRDRLGWWRMWARGRGYVVRVVR